MTAMAVIRSAINTIRAQKKIDRVRKQVPFATALMLTSLAKDGKAAGERRILKAFDEPTPFTRRGITIIPARKTNLVAFVLAKDIQADYLDIEETGGVRTPEPGSPVQVPVNLRINRFGNIPRGAIKRIVSKPTTFTISPREQRAARLPPGIYSRPKRGGTKLLVAFHKRAIYKPRFGFRPAVIRVVKRNVRVRWEQSLERALRNARD